MEIMLWLGFLRDIPTPKLAKREGVTSRFGSDPAADPFNSLRSSVHSIGLPYAGI
jgi:glutaminase